MGVWSASSRWAIWPSSAIPDRCSARSALPNPTVEQGGPSMPRVRTFLVATALGAAASYFFDPEKGAGRRAKARDQVDSVLRRGRHSALRTAMQIEDRARGRLAEVQHARDKR